MRRQRRGAKLNAGSNLRSWQHDRLVPRHAPAPARWETAMDTSLLRRVAITFALAAALSLIASPVAAAPSGDYDPAKLANISIANRLVADVLNGQDAAAAAALVSEDAIIQTQFGEYTGPSGLLAYVAALKHTYPGATFSVLAVESTGDDVAVDWLLTSTRIRMATTGEVASVNIELRGTSVIATDDGQVAGVSFDPGIAVLPDTTAYTAAPGGDV
jgi:predicted SnoaL-like aldol condensation-catalyzing enzyme